MKEEIKTAVNLWVEQIREPLQDAGDVMINAMASWAKSIVKPVTDEQLKVFAQTLEEEVEKYIKETGWSHVTLSTDYHPDPFLHAAITKAGINSLVLPIKSVVWIEPGKVTHSFGYGAERKVINVTSQVSNK